MGAPRVRTYWSAGMEALTAASALGHLRGQSLNDDPAPWPCKPGSADAVGLTGLVGLAKGMLASAHPPVGAVILLAEW